MNVYTFLLAPVLMGLILILFFRHKVVWWELAIPIAFTIVFVVIAKLIAVTSLTSDTEWLGGYVKEVRYYEDWNEYIHRICSYQCGKSTCYRDCSYVRYHPQYWEAITTIGNYGISRDRYNRLVKQFKDDPHFKDLHRHYHTNDGDMYYSKWQGDDASLEPVTCDELYENKPKAALNIFHFDPVDSFDLVTYKPFDYAPITDVYNQKCVLGSNNAQWERQVQLINAKLGGTKQIRVYFCVFKNQPREAGMVQERYWEGGNKNELVICIGVDSNENIQWVYDFSWTDKKDILIETRSYIEQQHKLDIASIVGFLYGEIDRKWVRKDFNDFDYLTIEPTVGQSIVILILVLIANGAIGWWIVANEFQ